MTTMNRISFRRASVWLLLAVALFWTASAQAQLSVDLQIKRRLYMINEPLLATVVVTNNSGREIMLADTKEGGPWFSFQIVGNEQRIVPPRDANYNLAPLLLRAGETIKRTVNLNELYSLGDFGSYTVKASVYLPTVGKYFGSRPKMIELTEGKVIWREQIGVPEGTQGDQYRTFSLLTMEQDGAKYLYVRLQGQTTGQIYCCYQLARMVTGYNPDAKLDAANNLAILHLVAPKQYMLTVIGIDGTIASQTTYVTPKTQPFLRKAASGNLEIVNAVRQEPAVAASARASENGPKLSDRPPGF